MMFLIGFDGVCTFFANASLREKFHSFDYLYGFTVYVYLLKNVYAFGTYFADITECWDHILV